MVCVLRNQLAYLQSIYLQVTRDWLRHGLRGIPECSACATGTPPGCSSTTARLYDHLLAGFAAEEIVLHLLRGGALARGGILGALFDRLDLPARRLAR